MKSGPIPQRRRWEPTGVRRRATAPAAALSTLALLAAGCSDGGGGDLDSASAEDPLEITMYYPIAVGGPLQEVVDDLVAEFEEENPEISVEAVYSGDYDETVVAVQTAVEGGDAPSTSVLLSADMYQLIEDEMIVPFDDVVTEDEDREWLDSFYEGFLDNSRDAEGQTWGIPFQRSTIVQFWNKDHFEEAGLDPDQAPQTWGEVIEYGEQVQDSSDARWGVQIPSVGFAYWLFQALTIQAGAEIVNAEGTEVDVTQPEAVEALEYWVDLSEEHGVHPDGVADWGTTPEDFLQGETAMMWTTTGQLSTIVESAEFDFGVDLLPEGAQRGSPTGGGNFYLFADATEDEQVAAMRLIRFLTEPEQAAQWSIATGYVAPTPEAWETQTMRDYVAEVPQAEVARDQLDHAVRELSTYQRGRVYEAMNDAIQGALVGDMTPEEALDHAQEQADSILDPYND